MYISSQSLQTDCIQTLFTRVGHQAAMLGRQAQNDFDRAVGRMAPQGALAKVASQMDSLNTPFVRLIFLAASCEAFGIDVLIYFDYLCQQQFQNSVVPAIQNFFQRPYGYQNTQSLGLIMNFLHFYFLECQDVLAILWKFLSLVWPLKKHPHVHKNE